MALRTGGLSKGGRGSVRLGDTPQITALRKEVREKSVKVEALKEQVRELQEKALSESTKDKAFEAFRAGPVAFERDLKKEIVPVVQSGKIADSVNSLSERGSKAEQDAKTMSAREWDAKPTLSAHASDVSRTGGEEENGTLDLVDGMKVFEIEEIVLGEEDALLEFEEEVVEVVGDEQTTVAKEQVVRTIPLTEDDKGDVRGLSDRFQTRVNATEAEKKLAKAEERRRMLNRQMQKENAEKHEREKKLSDIQEMRRKREEALVAVAKANPPRVSDFTERWPVGEPHKLDQKIKYLTELSIELSEQEGALQQQITHLQEIA